MNEEARLQSDIWLPLLDVPDGVGCYQDKYSDNSFIPYLVMNCQPVSSSVLKPRDEDEIIEVHHGITYNKLMGIINRDEMNVAGAWCSLLAIRTLEQNGFVVLKYDNLFLTMFNKYKDFIFVLFFIL